MDKFFDAATQIISGWWRIMVGTQYAGISLAAVWAFGIILICLDLFLFGEGD